jgi:hypothetical protein
MSATEREIALNETRKSPGALEGLTCLGELVPLHDAWEWAKANPGKTAGLLLLGTFGAIEFGIVAGVSAGVLAQLIGISPQVSVIFAWAGLAGGAAFGACAFTHWGNADPGG